MNGLRPFTLSRLMTSIFLFSTALSKSMTILRISSDDALFSVASGFVEISVNSGYIALGRSSLDSALGDFHCAVVKPNRLKMSST